MSSASSARSLAFVALLVAIAWLTAGDLPALGGDEASHHVVGDLKLADADEDPSDGVEGTFTSQNLAPGDRYVSQLTLIRESPTDLPPVAEPQVTVQILPNGTSPALAGALHITQLEYGSESLEEDARRACGSPLTVARLTDCTHTENNPLADLPDPTPEGRELRIGLRFAESAGSALGDQLFSFSVEAELHGHLPARAQNSPSSTPPAVGETQPPCTLDQDPPAPLALDPVPQTQLRPGPIVSELPDPPVEMSRLLEVQLPDGC